MRQYDSTSPDIYCALAVKKQMKPISTSEDLVLVFGLMLAALVVASVPVFSATVVRPIIGTIAVLFVPGYVFIAALFPQKTTLRNGVGWRSLSASAL